MKNVSILVAIIMASFLGKSQTIDSIPHHHTGHSTYPC